MNNQTKHDTIERAARDNFHAAIYAAAKAYAMESGKKLTDYSAAMLHAEATLWLNENMGEQLAKYTVPYFVERFESVNGSEPSAERMEKFARVAKKFAALNS